MSVNAAVNPGWEHYARYTFSPAMRLACRIHNQHRELVLEGEHVLLLKRRKKARKR